jgi:RNA polymerase sigma factor (sigma-70 family)
MSPASLRRYRADRLLREGFEELRVTVIAGASGRLRAAGVRLDAADIEACYAQAWQGLYTATLDGRPIANPVGWLTLVTYRRAIDEHRARARARPLALDGAREDAGGTAPTAQRDLAEELDDRVQLRQLFEALRGRLSEREQQAATLCYLQGLSRAQAAAQMGVSERRMRKLMEGRGGQSPGVAHKVGALVETIGAGRWCEEQGSLMRGFAYGILDPAGERHRLAEIHHSECPACRAYVLSLRGLAAVLPPLPSLLHLALGAGAGTVASSGVGAGTGSAANPGAGAAGAGAAGAGALSASGAAGAGGGWWLAGGSLGAKLGAGCLLALGVGAGCVALSARPARVGGSHRRHATAFAARRAGQERRLPESLAGTSARGPLAAARPTTSPTTRANQGPSSPAAREFGPEQTFARGASSSASSSSTSSQGQPRAASASSGGRSTGGESSSAKGATSGSSGEFTSTAQPAPVGHPATRSSAGAVGTGGSAARHEFGIG